MKRAIATVACVTALLGAPSFAAATTFLYDVTGSSLSGGTPDAATFTLDSSTATATGDDSIGFSDVLVTTGTSQRDVDLTFLGSSNIPFGAGFVIYQNGSVVGGGTGSTPLFTGPETDPVLSTGTFTFTAYDGPGAITAQVSLVSPAPEPSTWALLIAGVGMIGATLRIGRRRGALTAAA